MKYFLLVFLPMLVKLTIFFQTRVSFSSALDFNLVDGLSTILGVNLTDLAVWSRFCLFFEKTDKIWSTLACVYRFGFACSLAFNYVVLPSTLYISGELLAPILSMAKNLSLPIFVMMWIFQLLTVLGGYTSSKRKSILFPLWACMQHTFKISKLVSIRFCWISCPHDSGTTRRSTKAFSLLKVSMTNIDHDLSNIFVILRKSSDSFWWTCLPPLCDMVDDLNGHYLD